MTVEPWWQWTEYLAIAMRAPGSLRDRTLVMIETMARGFYDAISSGPK